MPKITKAQMRQDELTRAKNRTEVDYAHQIENYDTRADLIGMLATFFDDPEKINTWLDPYRAAKSDDLRRVAQTYLVPENRVATIFTPEAA